MYGPSFDGLPSYPVVRELHAKKSANDRLPEAGQGLNEWRRGNGRPADGTVAMHGPNSLTAQLRTDSRRFWGTTPATR